MSLAAQSVVVFEHVMEEEALCLFTALYWLNQGRENGSVQSPAETDTRLSEKAIKNYEEKLKVYEADLQSWAVLTKPLPARLGKISRKEVIVF